VYFCDYPHILTRVLVIRTQALSVSPSLSSTRTVLPLQDMGGLGDVADFDAREEATTKILLDVLPRGGRGPLELLGEEDLEEERREGGREGGGMEGECVISSTPRLKCDKYAHQDTKE